MDTYVRVVSTMAPLSWSLSKGLPHGCGVNCGLWFALVDVTVSRGPGGSCREEAGQCSLFPWPVSFSSSVALDVAPCSV